MSWGYRILTAYIIGVLFISFFVYKSMQVNIDLAEENYYEKELKYNAFALSKKNGESLRNQVTISKGVTELNIQFKDSLVKMIQKPFVQVYYPVNKAFDTFLQLNAPLKSSNIIDITKLHKGACIVKITFELQGEPYYIEQALNL
jgi:anaerobic C4-dicarboxylate transporter